MRYRATFLAGLAVGFVAGTRAGRERYEQMKKLARTVVESPAVRNATRAALQRAAMSPQVAKDKAATRVPRLTETAKQSASKVRGQLDRIPGWTRCKPARGRARDPRTHSPYRLGKGPTDNPSNPGLVMSQPRQTRVSLTAARLT